MAVQDTAGESWDTTALQGTNAAQATEGNSMSAARGTAISTGTSIWIGVAPRSRCDNGVVAPDGISGGCLAQLEADAIGM